jgi:hypothetical protein
MNKDRNTSKWWPYSDKTRHVTQTAEEARRKDRSTNFEFGAKEQAQSLTVHLSYDDDDDDYDDDDVDVDNYNSSKATYCRHD